MPTSSTPSSTVTLALPGVLSWPARISRYVLAHEHLLIVLLLVGAALYGARKVENIVSAHDQHVLAVRQTELAATVASNAQKTASEKQADADRQAALDAAARANAQLEATNRILADALSKQKQIDQTLPPPQLAVRIEQLSGAPTGSVTPTADNGYKVTQSAAVAVAQTLEENLVLKQQLSNSKSETANTQKALDASTKDVAASHEVIGGLQTQLKQADGVCQQQIKVEKDKARKGKVKWFIGGWITGVLTRPALKLLTGI